MLTSNTLYKRDRHQRWPH